MTVQHREATHRLFRCNECGRGFRTADGVNQARVFNSRLNDHLLTGSQHWHTEHCLQCPECDNEFTTQDALDQVFPLPIASWLNFPPVSTALRYDPPLGRVFHV